MNLFHAKTTRTEIDSLKQYATPLLREKDAHMLKAPAGAVLSILCQSEYKLKEHPELATIYK